MAILSIYTRRNKKQKLKVILMGPRHEILFFIY